MSASETHRNSLQRHENGGFRWRSPTLHLETVAYAVRVFTLDAKFWLATTTRGLA